MARLSQTEPAAAVRRVRSAESADRVGSRSPKDRTCLSAAPSPAASSLSGPSPASAPPSSPARRTTGPPTAARTRGAAAAPTARTPARRRTPAATCRWRTPATTCSPGTSSAGSTGSVPTAGTRATATATGVDGRRHGAGLARGVGRGQRRAVHEGRRCRCRRRSARPTARPAPTSRRPASTSRTPSRPTGAPCSGSRAATWSPTTSPATRCAGSARPTCPALRPTPEILLSGDTVVAIAQHGRRWTTPTRASTDVVTLDVSDPAAPTVTHTVEYDTALVTARLHDGVVRRGAPGRAPRPRLRPARQAHHRVGGRPGQPGRWSARARSRTGCPASPPTAARPSSCSTATRSRSPTTAPRSAPSPWSASTRPRPRRPSVSGLAVDTDLAYASADQLYLATSAVVRRRGPLLRLPRADADAGLGGSCRAGSRAVRRPAPRSAARRTPTTAPATSTPSTSTASTPPSRRPARWTA